MKLPKRRGSLNRSAPPSVEVHVDVIVQRRCERRGQVAQAARHAEMHEQRAGGGAEQQVFGAPLEAADARARELRAAARRATGQRRRGSRTSTRGDRAADDVGQRGRGAWFLLRAAPASRELTPRRCAAPKLLSLRDAAHVAGSVVGVASVDRLYCELSLRPTHVLRGRYLQGIRNT